MQGKFPPSTSFPLALSHPAFWAIWPPLQGSSLGKHPYFPHGCIQWPFWSLHGVDPVPTSSWVSVGSPPTPIPLPHSIMLLWLLSSSFAILFFAHSYILSCYLYAEYSQLSVCLCLLWAPGRPASCPLYMQFLRNLPQLYSNQNLDLWTFFQYSINATFFIVATGLSPLLTSLSHCSWSPTIIVWKSVIGFPSALSEISCLSYAKCLFPQSPPSLSWLPQ